MVETKSLEKSAQIALTDDERKTFAEITAGFHLDPELIEDTKACVLITEELSNPDLQQPKAAELSAVLGELTDELLEHRHDAVVAKVMEYASHCEARSITTLDRNTGATITEFVTTNPERTQADLDFRIVEFANGKVKISVEVPLRGDEYEAETEPFFVSADNEGNLQVEQRIWKNGQYQYIDLPLGDGTIGNERLRRFFNFNTEAINLAKNRPPEEQARISARAKQYLLEKKFDRQPLVAA